MNLTSSSRAHLQWCFGQQGKSRDSKRRDESPAVRSRKASAFAAIALTGSFAAAHAQISLTSAVDLALKNSPQVKMAEDNLTHARASRDEAHDVYIPTISASSGIGFMAMNAREFLMVDVVVVSILIYAALGKLADSIARLLERTCLRWNPVYSPSGT